MKSSISQSMSRGTLNADISSTVQTEISTLLQGKSYEELTDLQKQVQAKLTGSEPVDVDYWENLLKSLVIWKAKVCHHCAFTRQ